MKKAVLSSVLMALCILTLAQAPESFNYQVVVRDGTTNSPLTNQNVSFLLSILKGSSSGESQYSELHSANTGALGIVNLVIGNGTDNTGNITTIDWGADTYYLKVEIDKTGGSSYTEMGTTQLLSVPYAMHSKTVSDYTETQDLADVIILNNAANAQIKNLTDPTEAQDAATKAYVDGVKAILFRTTDPLILIAVGVSIQDLLEGGLTISDLLAAGISVSDLLAAGISVSNLFNAGVGVGTLKENGITQQTLTDLGLIGTLSDIDGYTYNWVKIGDQIWMAENLKYLPSVVGPGTSSETTPYYYVYGYDGTNVTDAKATANYVTYGVLYNWTAAMNGAGSSSSNPSGIQGVCPTGWHLPSDAEWTQLTDYLTANRNSGTEGTVLKATSGWNTSGNGTDNYGFTALPGGTCALGVSFIHIGNYGFWWGATENNASNTLYRSMCYNLSTVYRSYYNNKYGLSVRCIKD